MQGLHPPAEHLGERRDLLDRRDGQPCVAERLRRPARRHERRSQLDEGAAQLDDAGLVVDRQQRAPDRPDVTHRPPPARARAGRPPRAGPRSARGPLREVAGARPRGSGPRASPNRRRAAPRPPPARRSAPCHALVHQEDRDARDLHSVGERVSDAVHPGERRQERRMHVEPAPAVDVEDRLAEQAHVPRAHQRVDPRGPPGAPAPPDRSPIDRRIRPARSRRSRHPRRARDPARRRRVGRTGRA